MTWAAGRCSCRARSSIRPGTVPVWCSTWAGRCAAESCASRRSVWRSCSTTGRASRSPCSPSHSSNRSLECPTTWMLLKYISIPHLSKFLIIVTRECLNASPIPRRR